MNSGSTSNPMSCLLPKGANQISESIKFRTISFWSFILYFFLWTFSSQQIKAQGNSCANASVLTAGNCSGSFALDNTFTDSRCTGNRAAWFSFTPATTGIYTLTATGPAGRNPSIFVATACNAPGTCHNNTAGTVESSSVSLQAGITYFINAEITGNGTMVDFCISNVCIPSGISISCPGDLTVECEIDVPPANPNGVSFTSNCGGSVILESELIRDSSCRDRFTIERTYALRIGGVIYDRCIQEIEVNDSIGPSIICPGPVTVVCAGDIPQPNINMVISADHCGNTGITNSVEGDSIINYICPNNYTIIREYQATDLCGNTQSCTQTITIHDPILPVAICTSNLIVYLGSDGLGHSFIGDYDAGSYDNCGGTLEFLADVDFTCHDIGVNFITLTVLDECHNSSQCTTSVEVIDTFSAVLVCRDFDVNLAPGECETILSYRPDLTAAFCDQNPYLTTLDSNTYVLDEPLGIGDHTVCYIVTDENGNTSTCCSQIRVIEFQNPIRELACKGQIQISLDDSCQATVTAEWILAGGPYGCYNSYIVQIQLWNGGPFIDRDPNKPGVQLDRRDIGKELKITITDPRTGNSCWGKATVEDKLPPILICPADAMFSCETLPIPANTGIPVVEEGCGNYTLNYHDIVTRGSCLQMYQSIITRIWTVEDDYGNKDTCIQTITILNGDLGMVSLPPDFDDNDKPTLSCDERIDRNKNIQTHLSAWPQCVDGYLLDSAYWLANPGLADVYGQRRLPRVLGWNDISNPSDPHFGHPNPDPVYYPSHPVWTSANNACWGPNTHVMWLGTGRPAAGNCQNIATSYQDLIFDITGGHCEPGSSGCYKILRRWTLIDWCSGEIRTHDQTIKILDLEGPEVVYPNQLDVSMDPWVCTGRWDVAVPWLIDNCSPQIEYTVEVEDGTVLGNSQTGIVVVNLPEGWQKAWIIALDCCGNETRHEIDLHVYDFTPPQAICQTKTVVTLLPSADKGGSITKIFAKSFDDRSFDNCAEEVYFKVIRMDDLLGTLHGSLNDNTNHCGGANGDDDPNIVGNQIFFDDEVKFCCNDLGIDVMVVFRVFDVFPGEGPVYPDRLKPGGDLYGRYSDCMVQVVVQDKATPVIVPPSDVVVSCDFWFDIDDLDDINNTVFGTISPDAAWRNPVVTTDKVCEAYCTYNPTTKYPGAQAGTVGRLACDHYINRFDAAHPYRTYELKWGFDGYILSACGSTPTVSVIDQRECGQGRIQRIFSVPGPNGTVVSATQNIWVVNCRPFRVDYEYCNDTTKSDIVWPTGICDHKVIELTGCNADISPDNPLLGRPRVVNRGKDHCSLVAIIYKDEIYYTEESSCFKVFRKWSVIDWCQYDPNNNPNVGRWEKVQVIKVHDLTAPDVTCNMGPCEPASKDSITGICEGHISLTANATDFCTPSDWLIWEYKIDLYNDGVGIHGGYDYRVGSLKKTEFDAGIQARYKYNPNADFPGNPFDASGVYPIGVHKISWFVEDGCGNIGVCTKLFEIEDCKAPTPVCLTGIVTVPMPSTGCIDVWASDLNAYSYDNCTPSDKLKFYFDGDTSKRAFTICCEDFVREKINDEMVIDVIVWVEDEEGNRDYCKTLVIIQDNLNTCPNVGTAKGRVSGLIKTAGGEEASPVEMSLYNKGQLIRQMKGSPYAFSDLDLDEMYQIIPARNDENINGVSTQDIVRIQKHILGQSYLEDPYKLIAADVNKTSTITASDISEIRKLILGVTEGFSKTNSWTFVPGNYSFANPKHPFDAPDFHEFMLNDSKSDLDFVAIKMGDVTGDALARTLTKSESRNRSELKLTAHKINTHKDQQDKLQFGLRAMEFNQITGMQFTLRFDPTELQFEGIQSGSLEISESNYNAYNLKRGLITFSWNSPNVQHGTTANKTDDLFVVTFGKLRDKVQIPFQLNNDKTIAEAYNVNQQIFKIGLEFVDPSMVSEFEFKLFQNEPNPFNESTEIRFILPDAGTVKLSFYDVLGKVIRVYDLDGQKGFNSKIIHRSEINATGIIYYQLDAESPGAAHTATGKMMLLQE
ncbi:MAG: hypothetical protein IPM48_03205 [Saprospiraceae bacterium]|nr:hypothetical protein [Saprospiraceae bacterium]